MNKVFFFSGQQEVEEHLVIFRRVGKEGGSWHIGCTANNYETREQFTKNVLHLIPHGNAREDSAKRASTRENMAARAQLFYRYDTYTRRFYRYETVTRELFSSVYHQN